MPSVVTILAMALLLMASRAEAYDWDSLTSTKGIESCSDADCWNRNSLRFLNEYRMKLGKDQNGKGPLVLGTPRMLEVAVEHSRVMSMKGDLYHGGLQAANDQVNCKGLTVKVKI